VRLSAGGAGLRRHHHDATLVTQIHPDDFERVIAGVNAIAESGEPFAAEYRMIARDGTTVWVRDVALPEDLADGSRGLRGYLLDITETVVADRTPLISYVDFPGDDLPTAYVSPNVSEILGYSADELIGPGDIYFALVHPDDRAAAIARGRSRACAASCST
jgi:PAS domain-containing protein